LAQPEVINGGDGCPPEPDWASIYDDDLDVALAHDVWGVVIREMRERDILSVVNGIQMKRYVETCVLYAVASRQVIEVGAVIPAPKTGTPQYSPWWSVMKDADARASVHEAELGISPRRRAGATKVQRGSKKVTAADKYLKSVSK
jgi:phage terminase small subunit